MMAFMPAPFQMRMTTRMVGHSSARVYQEIFFSPRKDRMMFINPFLLEKTACSM